ncbi:MAG: lactonase family protein [Lachnospiraceae bacterium]|nr:lactonase family protein [Lachnospiraceae bacterium]
MGKEKYVAYVSTYTYGNKSGHGIRIYDVDMENGRFSEKDQVQITNSSYVTISHNQKYLYSITDFGVESYKILKDGSLEILNHAHINGMRGRHLSTDYEDRFLFVAGYHDAKLTALQVNEDGSIGEITEEIFHKGLGSIAERNFRPHISCVKMTRDNKFLCAADPGMDHVVVYELNHATGKLRQVDIIRSEQESAPHHLKFSKDGKFLYIVHELKNYIDVYTYEQDSHGNPVFEKIQNVPTLNTYHASGSAACALNFSEDFQYICSSNAGDNSAVVYSIDQESGMLNKCFCLPVSGDYPKDVTLFPDNRHLVSLNHESDTMTFFGVNMEKGIMVMNGRELRVDQPNCIIFYRLK